MVLALVAQRNLRMVQINVKPAFQIEALYISQLEVLVVQGKERKEVTLLRNSLYELRQATREWNEAL